MSDLSKWYYHLQQDSERAQATCMIDLAETMRDWSTDKYKQMQVSYVRNHFSRTIDIYQETKDEFLKDTDDHSMIYSHQFLQFLSTLYQELLEDCSFHDSTYSKEDYI